jgi:hypothetical protein
MFRKLGGLSLSEGLSMNYSGPKLLGLITAAAFAAITLIASNGWAQARKTTITCTTESNGNVDVSFKISGVGNGDLCVTSSGTYTANCACQNNGGNCPSAVNKRSQAVPTKTGQSFSSTNGQISGSEVLTAPTETACTLTCPGGQTSILAEVVEPSSVSVNVFAPGTFTQSDNTCTPDSGAAPIRSGSCTPSPAAIIFNSGCAALF